MSSETRLQPVAFENVVISPAKRGGALVHVVRGKGLSPAASDELPYILMHYPEVAALVSGEGKAALEALQRAKAGYEATAATLTRERAECAERLAAVKKLARPLAEIGALAGDIAAR